jgi:hypothetical protein
MNRVLLITFGGVGKKVHGELCRGREIKVEKETLALCFLWLKVTQGTGSSLFNLDMQALPTVCWYGKARDHAPFLNETFFLDTKSMPRHVYL